MSSQAETSSGFIIRNARSEDKEQALAFTAHTWDFGDYIQYVYDEWLDDKAGLFLVAEEKKSGRLAAVDKLTILSPTEAWFEGLRVNPAFRGRGLAGELQQHMIGEARHLGAQTVRLLTLLSNQAVHRNAYRDGFSRLFTVRFWKWREPGIAGAQASDRNTATELRGATTEEAPLLFEWWQKSSSFATARLLHRSWAFSGTSVDEWFSRAAAGELYVPQRLDATKLVLPPAMVMVWPERQEDGSLLWKINLLSALGEEWEGMARGLIQRARRDGVAQIEGLLPDSIDTLMGLRSAGFTPDKDDERLCLFELCLS